MAARSNNDALPALVLIHGVGLDHAMWTDVRTSLDARTVIAYDMLGHGDDPAMIGPFTLWDFVDQLELVLSQAGVGECDVVGFSMGALVAQGFAARAGSRVRRMILLNPVFNRSPEQRRDIHQRVDDVRRGGYRASVDGAVERWFSPDFTVDSPATVETIRGRLERNVEAAYAEAYAVFADADAELVEHTAAIHCPTLIVTGGRDQRSTPAMATAMTDALADATSIVIDGARHMTPVEFPQLVAGLINQFCRVAVVHERTSS